jgi:hypothetical protein
MQNGLGVTMVLTEKKGNKQRYRLRWRGKERQRDGKKEKVNTVTSQ